TKWYPRSADRLLPPLGARNAAPGADGLEAVKFKRNRPDDSVPVLGRALAHRVQHEGVPRAGRIVPFGKLRHDAEQRQLVTIAYPPPTVLDERDRRVAIPCRVDAGKRDIDHDLP